MPVNLNIFTARFRDRVALTEPLKQAPTVVAPPPRAPEPQRSPAVEKRFQDGFEAAAPKRDDLPNLTVPDAPGMKAPRGAKEPREPKGTKEPREPKDAAPVNEAAQAQAEKGWDTDAEAVAQTTQSGCGEASLAFVSAASTTGAEPPSEQQALQEVRATAEALNTQEATENENKANVDLTDGATAEEMGVVLGEMGIEVTDGYEKYDAKAMSEALKRGEFGLALVDSNAILNASLPANMQIKEPGVLHWVTIDGFNSGSSKKDASDDMYRVKDPVNGTYWVSSKDMEKAIKQGQQAHDGGGVLVVEKRKDKDVDTKQEREALAEANRRDSASLGKGGGHGSRRMSVGESS